MSQSEALIPEIFNLTLTDANTEYEQQLSKGTKHFTVQCRTAADMRVAFETGKVATPTVPYATIKSGTVYTAPQKVGWSWTSAADPDATMYLASGSAGVVAEIIAWKDKR